MRQSRHTFAWGKETGRKREKSGALFPKNLLAGIGLSSTTAWRCAPSAEPLDANQTIARLAELICEVKKMYEELVKKLRYCGNAISCPHCPYWEGCGGSKEDLNQAADVIEELDMKLHGANAAIAGMKREIERMVIDSANSNREMPRQEPPKEK